MICDEKSEESMIWLIIKTPNAYIPPKKRKKGSKMREEKPDYIQIPKILNAESEV